MTGRTRWQRASSSTGTSPAESGGVAGSLCSDDMIITSLAARGSQYEHPGADGGFLGHGFHCLSGGPAGIVPGV
jgi:hypothetical protein